MKVRAFAQDIKQMSLQKRKVVIIFLYTGKQFRMIGGGEKVTAQQHQHLLSIFKAKQSTGL